MNKIFDSSELVTNTALYTIFGEVENKIPDGSGLVTTSAVIDKAIEIDAKVFDYDKYIAILQPI